MGDTFKLAMQLTMVDMLSGVASRARAHIQSLGEAGKQVGKDFDQMERHITRGLKAVAVTNYAINKIKPGVAAAAGLQESTLDVKMNLMEAGGNAGVLAKQLAVVRATAIDIQKQMPFGAQEVMGIENVLLKAGLKMEDVTAKSGAAWAASALATISKADPQAMGEGMIGIAAPFNLKGGQFGDVANFLQKVDQASVTTIPELVEGMKYVSGTAANMKVSWQDTLTAMGSMSQQGLRGSMAGTSLNDFLVRMVGTSREERRTIAALNAHLVSRGKAPLKFFDDAGKLRPLPAIIDNIRTSLSGLTDKQRMFTLQKIFGEQGARAAFALIHEGAGSWEEVTAAVGKAADMQEKLTTRMEGFNANLKSLQGTSKTTAASFFAPWLEPLKQITAGANEATASLGKFADTHPKTTTAVNGVMAAGLATAVGYGAYNLVKGGVAGARVLKGLRGLGGTAMGVAEGKLLQSTTGVQPVFVTNAAEIAAGGGDTISKVAAGAGITGWAKSIWRMAGNPVAKGASYLPMLAARGGLIGLAGAGGYAVGTGINALMNGGISMMSQGRYGSLGEQLYDVIHQQGDYKPDINLSIQIDSQGRITSNVNSMGPRINTVKRGAFFDALTAVPAY